MFTYLELEWNGRQRADFGGVKNEIFILGAFDRVHPADQVYSFTPWFLILNAPFNLTDIEYYSCTVCHIMPHFSQQTAISNIDNNMEFWQDTNRNIPISFPLKVTLQLQSTQLKLTRCIFSLNPQNWSQWPKGQGVLHLRSWGGQNGKFSLPLSYFFLSPLPPPCIFLVGTPPIPIQSWRRLEFQSLEVRLSIKNMFHF